MAPDSVARSSLPLRRAAPADLPAVQALLATSGLPLDGVRDALDGFVVVEAGDGGGIVGVAGLERCGDDALLRSVAVDAAWRGRGVGRMLVDRLLGDAAVQNLRALYLLTTTAEGWFPGFGFAVVTRDAVPPAVRATAEFREACPASATVMRRAVTPVDSTAD